MSKIKSLSLAACAGALLFTASAGATNTATGFVTITSIKGTTSSTAGQMFFAMANPWPNTDGCTNTTYIVIQTAAPNYNLLETMLYDAYVNGDQVNFTLSGCAAIGSPTYPIIVNFTVQKS